MTDPNRTELAIVLDRSGSMTSIQADMEGGFAQFVAEQRTLPGFCAVSLYQFDSEYEVVYEELSVHDVPPLSITPRGSTPLLDAVGHTIGRLGERLAAKPEHERPAAVIVMVITDGEENASREIKREGLREMIDRQQRIYNWRFMYLGADASTFSEAESLGIRAAARYAADSHGVDQLYAASSAAVVEYRSRIARGDESAELEIEPDLKPS